MADKVKKAHGHIIQADWNQTDPLQMDYIHNKPELNNVVQYDNNGEINVNTHIEDYYSSLNDCLNALAEYSSNAASCMDVVVAANTAACNAYTAAEEVLSYFISSNVSVENLSSNIPIRNENGTFEIGSANINFVDGGGFSCPAQDAYNYALNENKGSLPVTVSDISSMLNNFDINLSGIKQAMYYGGGAFDESGCYGVLPIPTASDLQTFSDLPLFAKNKPTSIPVRTESGNIDVALTPTEEANAASKYYVDRYQKKISNRDLINETGTFDLKINYWEPLYNYNSTTDCIGGKLSVTLPQNLMGKTINISVANNSLSSIAPTSSGTTEMLAFVTNNTESSFAVNTGSSWETTTVAHEVTSTSAYIYLYIGKTIPASELHNYTYKYSEYLQLTYSYLEYSENGTPIHDTYLHSDTEIHLKDPIESLLIEDLVRCYPENIAQEWTISFITGNNLPSVTIPNNTTIPVRHAYLEDVYDSDYNIIGQKEKFEYVNESLPIKWLYAEPVFEANHRYLITFKQIIDNIYGIWTVLE